MSNEYGAIPLSTANAVGASLKKKMGSLTGYAPVEWAETINKLGNKLPERTVSGAVCSFSDGADDVPIKTATFNIDPTLDGVSEINVGISALTPTDKKYPIAYTQSGTGDPSLVNIRPITGGLTITRDDSSTLTIWGGLLNMSTGEVTVTHKEYSGSWTNYASSNGYKAYRSTVKDKCKSTTAAVCNKIDEFGSFSSGSMTTNIIQLPTGQVTNFYLALLDTEDPTTIQLVYELYESETVQLTSTELTRAIVALGGRTISLGQTVYGGSVTVDEDGACELTDGYKRVDMGTLNYTYVSAYQYFYAEISDKKEGMTNVKADGYTTTTVAFDGTQSDLTIKGGASNHRVFLTNRTYTDPNTLKTALSGVYLIYEVTTPTQTDLDPITPINTFLGMNNLWANTGDSEVTYFAQPNIPDEVLYKGQISTTSDYATANFSESVADDEEVLVKVYCPARSAVDYKVIKVSDIGNGLNIGFSLHTTVNCTITKTSIASYQYSGDYYDIYADVLAYDSAIFN